MKSNRLLGLSLLAGLCTLAAGLDSDACFRRSHRPGLPATQPVYFLASPALDSPTQARVTADKPAEETKPPTAELALKWLQEGNERFVKETLEKKDLGSKRREHLAKGQHPFAIVLTCSDSRVAPELIFNQGLGDLFVLRVAGNVTDPFILGTIEYAVEHLHVALIVVLGHESCGAVAGALTKGPFPDNLDKLLKKVHVGTDLPPERARALQVAAKNNALFHAGQMTLRSEALKKEVDEKKLRVVSGFYELSTGKIEWLNKKASSEK